MDEDRLKSQLNALEQWRTGITDAIKTFGQWLAKSEYASSEHDLRLFEAIDTVKSDKLTIAFVAEFSRGKTELINSIFFADYKRRLLPSTVGRTTMCPTELFYDNEEQGAYMRLLPIETRMEDKSVSDLKRDKKAWTILPLDVGSPDQMAETLREVVKVKRVSLEQARNLGMLDDETEKKLQNEHATELEIPIWRHAMISFPHPLLKQGLVIVDTPGLNALGTEPELTLSMLPQAQAVVFVLAPDTGVTKSDLDIWEYSIKSAINSDNPKGVIAALNKIDILWDEMLTEAEINKVIEGQCLKTAEMLGIDPANVIPVSAQKALVGKARQDQALIDKSRIRDLERHFADEIIPAKQRIVGQKVLREVGAMLDQVKQIVSAKHARVDQQIKGLQAASGRNTDVIKHLTQKTREQQVAYNNNMKYLQSSRRALTQHSQQVMSELSLEAFDYLLNKARKDMTESWTTAGLKASITTLFSGINDTMEVIARQMGETHALVQSVYKKFHDEHGLPEMSFAKFSVDSYRESLRKATAQAEEFRNSPVTTMTEQSFVVKKFFVSVVSHARETFFKAHQDAEKWLKEIMNPLIAQVHIHKQLLEQHLETLCKINETRETLAKNLSDLDTLSKSLKTQLNELQTIENALHALVPADLNRPETTAKIASDAILPEPVVTA